MQPTPNVLSCPSPLSRASHDDHSKSDTRLPSNYAVTYNPLSSILDRWRFQMCRILQLRVSFLLDTAKQKCVIYNNIRGQIEALIYILILTISVLCHCSSDNWNTNYVGSNNKQNNNLTEAHSAILYGTYYMILLVEKSCVWGNNSDDIGVGPSPVGKVTHASDRHC